jgi:hypothetical protein
MHPELVSALRARRPDVHARWEALLRIERAISPLADPDNLVHLINWTLDEIFRALPAPPTVRAKPAICPCGRNPYLAYFQAGEQAMQEALVLCQVALPPATAEDRDGALQDMKRVLGLLAHREIHAFCAVCQYRLHAEPAALVGCLATLPLAN